MTPGGVDLETSLYRVELLSPHATQENIVHAFDVEKPRPSLTLHQRWNDLDIDSTIFGCTHITFDECVNRNLFGLPRFHFSHVKMVKPGMPLFLFNYISKKIFGVYVAVSYGQQNIDPYAWTGRSPAYQIRTRFPSQVRVRLREDFEKLISLEEVDFRSLIQENYYSEKRFHFDLNSIQTYHLIKKFEAARDRLKLTEDALGATSSVSSERGWKTTSKYLLHQVSPEYVTSPRRINNVWSRNLAAELERPSRNVSTWNQHIYGGNGFYNLPVRYWQGLHHPNVPTTPVVHRQEVADVINYRSPNGTWTLRSRINDAIGQGLSLQYS